MEHVVERRKSKRGVSIKIQSPFPGRLERAADIETHQAVEKAHASPDAREWPPPREAIARARAAHVPEQHDAGARPRVRQLETAAPKGVADRCRAAIAAQRAGSTQIPVALDRDVSRTRATGNLDGTGEVARKWRRQTQRRTGTREVIGPGTPVDGDVGRPLRVFWIDAALRAENQGGTELIRGGRPAVRPRGSAPSEWPIASGRAVGSTAASRW